MSDLAQYLLAQATRRPAQTLQFATAELWRRGKMRWVNSIEGRFPDLSALPVATAFAPFLPESTCRAAQFRERFPEACRKIVDAADAASRHEFEILGSRYDAGLQIEWSLDWTTGHRWPDAAPDQVNVLAGSAGSDVKRPWELARFHHALPLGQAFVLTGDERYAAEFATQFSQWLAACPYPRGIHWAMPMEIGIRTVNLCVAGALVLRADSVAAGFWRQLLGSLFLHGRYLHLHREWNPVARGNHYLGSLLGLLHAGALFRELAEGRRWYDEAKAAILTEMDWQVGDDGVAHEGSSGYHGFVTEMMATAALLCARVEHPADAAVEPLRAIKKACGRRFSLRLEEMFQFPAALCEGRAAPPVLGDSDDARLLPLCANADAQPLAHLLALRDALFGADAGTSPRHECAQAWWMAGDAPAPTSRLGRASRAFPAGGFYFVASPRLRGSIRCGPLGVKGWANHAHCDQLSVEFALDGAPVLCDPGTYVYSADATARNYFRSSRAHNCPVVAGEEQNRFWPGLLFRIVDDTQSRVAQWAESERETCFSGSHDGYARLPQRVRTQREVTLNHSAHSLLICDTLTGHGEAPVEWNWQFAPGAAPKPAGDVSCGPPVARQNFALHSRWHVGPMEMRVWLCSLAHETHAEPFDGWVAPHYGVRHAAPGLRVACRATFPLKAIFEFLPLGASLPQSR